MWGVLELEKQRKCPYYIFPKGCSHLNDMDDLGECIYEKGIITGEGVVHCSQGKKFLKKGDTV